MQDGFIYIFSNPSYHNLLKIGKTTKTPDERAKELSSGTGVATPFKVEYEIQTSSFDKAEEIIHERLEKYRTNKKREFFELSLQEAISIVKQEMVPLLECEIDNLINEKSYKHSQLDEKLEDVIETKKELLNKIRLVGENHKNPSLSYDEAIEFVKKQAKKREDEERGEKQKDLYNIAVQHLINGDNFTAIDILRKSAKLGDRKAKYILFVKKDSTKYHDPMLTNKEFYELGIDLNNRSYIKRAAQMGNKQAKRFIDLNK
jgi:hypothetical protein